METALKYHSNNIKINISNINSLEKLVKQIKIILKIDLEKEIDIYILPEKKFI